MIEVAVYNKDGKKVDSVKLSEKEFGISANPGLIQEVVTAYLSNRRSANAHTKNRGEVRGGGKKPWRQKGTGRARHGSIRSPLWRGGGVTFGPRNTRNYVKKVNVQAKRKALKMSVSDKVLGKKFYILDQLEVENGKTKLLANLLRKLPAARSHLMLLDGKSESVVRAARNIPSIDLSAPRNLNTYDVLTHEAIVITKKGLEQLQQSFTKGK